MWAASRPDPELAVRVAFALWRFWQQRGYLNEARARLDDLDGPGLGPVARVSGPGSPKARGGVAYWQADQATAEACYTRPSRCGGRSAIDARSPTPSTTGPMPTRAWLMRRTCRRCQCRAATHARGGAPDLPGDRRRGRRGQHPLGDRSFHFFGSQMAEAETAYREALALHRAWGNRTMEAWSLHMLAPVAGRRGGARRGEERLPTRRSPISRRPAMWRGSPSSSTTCRGSRCTTTTCPVPAGCGARPAICRKSPGRTWRGSTRRASARSAIRPRARCCPPDDLERYGAEGAAMSLDEAVAYAFETFEAAAEPEPTGLP